LVDVDDTWHAGNYYQVGYKGATYGHNILGISEERNVHEFHARRHHKKGHNHLKALVRELKHLMKKFHL